MEVLFVNDWLLLRQRIFEEIRFSRLDLQDYNLPEMHISGEGNYWNVNLKPKVSARVINITIFPDT